MEQPATKQKNPRQPFPLRMPSSVRAAAEAAAIAEDRSLNWVLNDRLARAFGIEGPISHETAGASA